MEAIFNAACAAQEIPGVVLLASNATGDFQYAQAFGVRSLRYPSKPMRLDTTMWLASCTKLMTAVALLQCVENGLVRLEDDVTDILYELNDHEILIGFDDVSGEPIMKKRTTIITVKHLLTHSSGLSWDFSSPLLQKWREYKGQKIHSGKTVVERFSYPLTYEPGTSWDYSTGDWIGKLVERLNHMTLTEYMEQKIWGPLGIRDMTFHLDERNDLKERLADISMRDPSGSGKVVFTQNEMTAEETLDDMGGDGAYATGPEYMKILQSLLANDGRLLSAKTVETMFTPQLEAAQRKALNEMLRKSSLERHIPESTRVPEKSWGLASLIYCEDTSEWKKKGTTMWKGMANVTWVGRGKAPSPTEYTMILEADSKHSGSIAKRDSAVCTLLSAYRPGI